jgi:hypothetical protein
LASLKEFSSSHWPAPGVGRRSCGCRVDGPLNLQRDRLWVISFLVGVPQTACHKAVGVLLRTLG